jgi:hypothetical protein
MQPIGRVLRAVCYRAFQSVGVEEHQQQSAIVVMHALSEFFRKWEVNSVSVGPMAVNNWFQPLIGPIYSDSEEDTVDVAKPDTTIHRLVRIESHIESGARCPCGHLYRAGQPVRWNQTELFCQVGTEQLRFAAIGEILHGCRKQSIEKRGVGFPLGVSRGDCTIRK